MTARPFSIEEKACLCKAGISVLSRLRNLWTKSSFFNSRQLLVHSAGITNDRKLLCDLYVVTEGHGGMEFFVVPSRIVLARFETKIGELVVRKCWNRRLLLFVASANGLEPLTWGSRCGIRHRLAWSNAWATSACSSLLQLPFLFDHDLAQLCAIGTST